jgi:hypothetical protein
MLNASKHRATGHLTLYAAPSRESTKTRERRPGYAHNQSRVASVCRILFLSLLLFGQAQMGAASLRQITHSHEPTLHDLHVTVLDQHMSGEEDAGEHGHTIASPSSSEETTCPGTHAELQELASPGGEDIGFTKDASQVRPAFRNATGNQANAPPGKKTSRAPPCLNA